MQDDEVYHYHLDHFGTPKELTNDTGKIVWQVKYRTYGNVALQETEEIENNLRFQGQYYDEETDLHYNRHRYYNPNTGQFITQDPIGLLGGLNHYQYAENPTGWIDPLGLCKETDHRPPQEPGLQGVFPEALILAPLGMLGRFVGALRRAKGGDDFVDLTTPARRRHILGGDRTGGGHRPGTGKPGKSEFPAGRSDDSIIHDISNIATDPTLRSRASRGGRTITDGTRNGVDIRVIQEQDGSIVTGFPTNAPRNPR